MTNPNREQRVSDHAVEQLVGRLLQIGVFTAAAVTLIGGVALLTRHGGALASYAVFHGEPDMLRSIAGIVTGAFAGHTDAIAQLGLLLLIMTPIARVAFTLVAFLIQRDRTYVLVTTIVLVLLLYGLIFGRA